MCGNHRGFIFHRGMKGRCVFGVTARALPWGRVRQREALRCKSGNHSQTSVQASMHPQARPFARSGACVWMSVCSRCVPTSSSWGRVWGGGTIAYALAQQGVDILVLERGGALAAGAGELVPTRYSSTADTSRQNSGSTGRPRVRSRRALRRRRQHEGLRREPSPVPRAGLHRGRAPGGDLAGVALGYADLEPYLRRGRADVPCRRHDRRGPDRAVAQHPLPVPRPGARALHRRPLAAVGEQLPAEAGRRRIQTGDHAPWLLA
jgi:hypothetical protein